ncbi:MAG: CPBP family intramembrane glutamic endopeptidase [Mycetocola sp.]
MSTAGQLPQPDQSASAQPLGQPETPVPLRAAPLIVFLAISFGLSWLIALPLWMGDGIASPLFVVLATLMMFTPGIAALVVVFFVERPARRIQALGLWTTRPVKVWFGYLGLALVVPIALVLVALPIGSLFGVYSMDLVTFSGFAELLDQQLAEVGAPALPVSIGVLVLIQLLTIPIGAVLNVLPALGEELGWRGWLFPRLLTLGPVRAILISGVIWGLWHAPLILLGYNYPGVPGWLGVVLMSVMCILIGGIFGWLRVRSDSVWPAALAHGALNASAGAAVLFSAAGSQLNTAEASILGWSGWIVPAIVLGVILLMGGFRRPTPPVGKSAPTP